MYGVGNPRDTLIALGDTIVEASMSHRCRYFEIYAYRDIIKDLWMADKRVFWKVAPKPSMQDSMYFSDFWGKYSCSERKDHFNATFQTSLNEKELAFDAADIIKVGKDIFLRKSQTANFMAAQWLRREFPHLRVHFTVHKNDYSRHYDEHFITIRPPTQGSEGIVILNVNYPPTESVMQLWKSNNWKVLETNIEPPTPGCVLTKWNGLALNSLSLSPKCVLIEES